MRLGVVLLCTLAACAGDSAARLADTPRPPVVRTGAVSASGELPPTVYSGVLRSADEATVSFAVPGRIESTTVEAGTEVEAGTVLARLDAARYQLALGASRGQLAELEERLEQAIREEQRASRLANIDAAAFEEVERRRSAVTSLRNSVEAVRAQRDQAAWQLDEAVLRAPFAGIVTGVLADAGTVVSAGQPVLGLRSLQAVEVEVALVEADTSRVDVGDTVGVSFPLADLSGVKGTVTAVSRAAGTGTRGFPLVVGLPDRPELVPGLTARVAIPAAEGDDDELTVPLAAVVSPFGDRTHVIRVASGVSEAVDIKIGRTRGARVVVIGELSAGDQVVVAGHVGLVPGEPVEVR